MTREPEVLNTQETAIFLGVHVETVRRLARCGEIPSFKVGKDWRFRKEALLRWSEEQQRARAARCSVLVIDDEEKICKALVRVVEQFGCRARQALSGATGLDLVAEEVPDLILLDLKMPDMNGPRFLEELRKTHPDLPVVIVTAYPNSELMVEAMKHGPLMLLPKPFEAAQVEKVVGLVVGDRLTRSVRIEPIASVPQDARGAGAIHQRSQTGEQPALAGRGT